VTSEAAVDLDVMVVADVPMPHAYVFRPERGSRLTRFATVLRPGAEMVEAPCLAYVVRHPSAGTILIDTGFHPDASENPRKDFGAGMALLFRRLKPADVPYEEQLHRLGVEPTDVEQVIMTHLHADHTSGMRLLSKARFTCAREEWTAATARGAAGKGYVARHLPPESQMDLLDFETSTIDLLGDGSIRLISTPGHTPGHMSVLLRVAGERQVLVVGDAVYTLRSLREEIPPLLTASDELYMRSLRELKAFSEREPEAMLVPSHDPTAWRALDRDRRTRHQPNTASTTASWTAPIGRSTFS
jgi:glyoxylase-like metal-dependent hydrolase (beta-lactamase superfamily II)